MSDYTFDRWKSSTNLIFWGIVILSVFGWVAGLLGYFTGIADIIKNIESVTNVFGSVSDEISDVVSRFYGVYYTMQFITLAGWGCYLYGLNDFKTVQTTDNTQRLVSKINTACWLGVAAILLSLVNGMMNWIFMILFMIIGWVLNLISFVKFQSAFSVLKHCEEWNEKAREGASNLRMSAILNIWLIFWPVVCLGVGLVIAGSAWQHAKYVKDHAMEYAYSGGLDSIMQTVDNYKVLIVTVGVLLLLSALVMSIIQFVLRLTGWSKIHNGFLVENSANGHRDQPAVSVLGTVTTSGFCHKCGNPLNADAAFCAKCGTQRISVVDKTIEEKPIHATNTEYAESFAPATVHPKVYDDSDGFPLPVYEESEESNSRKKLFIYGGIGFGTLIVFLILWFALQGSAGNKYDERYVYLLQDMVYDTPSEYGDVIGELGYGEKVLVIEKVNGGEWCKVKFPTEDGQTKEGYMALYSLVDSIDFETLEQAGLKHDYVKAKFQSDRQSLAVLDYFKQNRGDSIKILSPDVYGVCLLSDNINGVETLAFVAGKKYTDDVLVIYTIDEDGHPHLHSQNEMPKDAEGIKSILGDRGDIHVTLTPKQGNKGINISLDEQPDEDLGCYGEPEGDEYTHEYAGTIDGKYAIEMTLTSDGGAFYTGEYFYTKNKTPIQLRGQLTDDCEHLVLEEYVGLNMTGKFEGTLSRNEYSGTWTNADGENSMPFKVTLKR